MIDCHRNSVESSDDHLLPLKAVLRFSAKYPAFDLTNANTTSAMGQR